MLALLTSTRSERETGKQAQIISTSRSRHYAGCNDCKWWPCNTFVICLNNLYINTCPRPVFINIPADILWCLNDFHPPKLLPLFISASLPLSLSRVTIYFVEIPWPIPNKNTSEHDLARWPQTERWMQGGKIDPFFGVAFQGYWRDLLLKVCKGHTR